MNLFPSTSIIIILLFLVTSSTASSSINLQIDNQTSPRIYRSSYARKKPLAAYQFLAPQNAARRALHLPPLVWDPRLVRYAKWWANQRRRDCALAHSNGPYGENIFWGSGKNWKPTEAAADWVSERKYYNYWFNSCSGGQECGHYTQVVWRGSRRIGCAKVNCYYGQGVFMICNYDPPGNYIGEKPY